MPLIWYSTWIGIYAEGAEEYDGHDIADEYDEQLYEEAIEPKSLEEGEYEYDGDGIKWDEDEDTDGYDHTNPGPGDGPIHGHGGFSSGDGDGSLESVEYGEDRISFHTCREVVSCPCTQSHLFLKFQMKKRISREAATVSL